MSSAVAAAKKSTCLSNFRQVGQATQMYQIDYDDTFTPVNHQPAEQPNSRNDKTWVQLLLPYVRSFAIFRCPSDESVRPRSEALFDQDLVPGDTYSQFYTASMRTNLGFNFQYLSPIVHMNGRWQATPRTGSWVRDPSSTLLYVDSVWSRNAEGNPYGGGSWLVVPPCRYENVAQGRKDTFLGRFDTGTLVFTTSNGWAGSSESPFLFGGAWPWHGERMTMARVDGSVISITPGQLGAGCDVQPNWTGTIFDSPAYLWDIN